MNSPSNPEWANILQQFYPQAFKLLSDLAEITYTPEEYTLKTNIGEIIIKLY